MKPSVVRILGASSFFYGRQETARLVLSNRYPATGGGEVYMENLAVSFLVTFMASIAAYYVCKWLDGDK